MTKQIKCLYKVALVYETSGLFEKVYILSTLTKTKVKQPKRKMKPDFNPGCN